MKSVHDHQFGARHAYAENRNGFNRRGMRSLSLFQHSRAAGAHISLEEFVDGGIMTPPQRATIEQTKIIQRSAAPSQRDCFQRCHGSTRSSLRELCIMQSNVLKSASQ